MIRRFDYRDADFDDADARSMLEELSFADFVGCTVNEIVTEAQGGYRRGGYRQQ